MIKTFEQIKKTLGEKLEQKVSNYIKESLGQLELPETTQTDFSQNTETITQPDSVSQESDMDQCACCLDKIKALLPEEFKECISWSKFSNMNTDCSQFDYKIIIDCPDLEDKTALETILMQAQYKTTEGGESVETSFKCKEKAGKLYCKGCYCETVEAPEDEFFKEFESVTESETVVKLSPATADKKLVEVLPGYFDKYSKVRVSPYMPERPGKFTLRVENLTDCSFDFKMFIALDANETNITEKKLPQIVEDLKRVCKSDKMMAKIVLPEIVDKEQVLSNRLVVFGSFNC
jgi:hypothetical protein